MEKIVVVASTESNPIRSCREVQQLLEAGWTVKFLNTMANEDGMTAIFILEKHEP